jgi:hypothetical protein
MRILAPFLALILLLGPLSASPARGGDIPTGQAFVLGVGEEVVVNGNTILTLRFDEILGDSRCPLDVLCFWEGEATAQLSLASPGEDGIVVDLHTANSPFGESSVEFKEYSITLLDVIPYPELVSQPIDPSRYKIEIVVEALAALSVPTSSWSVMKASFR